MSSARFETAVTKFRIAGFALVIILSVHPAFPTIAHASEMQGRAISPAEREYRSTGGDVKTKFVAAMVVLQALVCSVPSPSRAAEIPPESVRLHERLSGDQ